MLLFNFAVWFFLKNKQSFIAEKKVKWEGERFALQKAKIEKEFTVSQRRNKKLCG